MMLLEEGNELLQSSFDKNIKHQKYSIDCIENCLNNPKDGIILKLALSLAMSNAADAVEIMCIGFIMSEMKDISSSDKEYLSSAVFFGMLLGGLFIGGLSDLIGRKPCLFYSLLLNTVSGLLSAVSPNITFLICCRVLGGIGIGGSVPVVFALGAEIYPSSVRGKYLSVIASFWMVGAIFTSFTAWIMLGNDLITNKKILPDIGWRSYAVVSALPALITTCLTYYIIPESPRFLYSKGRYVETLNVLKLISVVHIELSDLIDHHHPNTDTNNDTYTHIYNENHHVLDIKLNNINKFQSNHYMPIDNQIPQTTNRYYCSLITSIRNIKLPNSYSILFHNPQIFPITMILMVIWFSLSFGSYGIATWISILFFDVGIKNPYAASFVFSLANLPGNLISFIYIEKYGRRSLLSIGMCIAGISVLGFAFDSKSTIAVIICSSLFNAFSVVGWNSLDCLSGFI